MWARIIIIIAYKRYTHCWYVYRGRAGKMNLGLITAFPKRKY